MKHAKFSATKKEVQTIQKIVARGHLEAQKNGVDYDRSDMTMDLEACHSNGTPLDLDKFLAFDDANFAHDLLGIMQNINRVDGTLGNCFLPRCAKPTK